MSMLHWNRSESRGEGVMGSRQHARNAVAGRVWVVVAALLTLVLLLSAQPLFALRQRPVRPSLTFRVALHPELPRDPRYYAYLEIERHGWMLEPEDIEYEWGAEGAMYHARADERLILLPVPIRCDGTVGLLRVRAWDPTYPTIRWMSGPSGSAGWWVDVTPFYIPPTCW